MDPPLEKHNANEADLHHEPAATVDTDMRSRDASNERLISVLQTCFADLAKKNEEQMDKLQTAVEGLKPKPVITDKKTKFWNLYKTLADEYDKDILEKYGTDLDTSLIFAGLFSAVSSAFIIQIQPGIQPHQAPLIIVLALCLLYISLCSTLLLRVNEAPSRHVALNASVNLRAYASGNLTS
ncbi:hypothetical protein C8R44DRAFT_886096 [Mycena epipterygia]|nr:hypothetical protein C8R44DRAFT_886096 [Mycena epipterygia]